MSLALSSPKTKYPDAESVSLRQHFDGTVRLRQATAQRWMKELNPANRNIRDSHVEWVAELIRSGQFSGDHPSPVVFDTNGHLADGQHRISGFIASGIEDVLIHLRCGMPVDLREHIDTGLTRTLSDRITFDNDHAVNRIISSIIISWSRYSGGKHTVTSGRKLTPAEANKIMEEHSEAIMNVARMFRSKQKGVTRMSVAVALAELYERDAGVADAFSASLLDNTGTVNDCQPARKLRDILLASSSIGGRTGSMDLYRKSVACMMAAMDGVNINKVSGRTWPK